MKYNIYIYKMDLFPSENYYTTVFSFEYLFFLNLFFLSQENVWLFFLYKQYFYSSRLTIFFTFNISFAILIGFFLVFHLLLK